MRLDIPSYQVCFEPCLGKRHTLTRSPAEKSIFLDVENPTALKNYSSSIPFCNDSGNNTKPWTNDRGNQALASKTNSVKEHCIRSSPIKQITVDEIKRIAAQGCRVTYAEPPTPDFMRLMRRVFDSGLALKSRMDRGNSDTRWCSSLSK